MKDGKLTAGGKDYKFGVVIPITTVSLSVTAYMAQLTGDVAEDGGDVTVTNGLIGGAVPKQTLLDAVDAIPEDVELPVSKEMIKGLIKSLIKCDIDTNGDGTVDKDGVTDGASIGIKFGSIPGTILGIQPDEEPQE